MKKIAIAAGALLLVGAGIWLGVARTAPEKEEETQAPSAQTAKRKAPLRKRAKVARPSVKKPAVKPPKPVLDIEPDEDEEDKRTPAEKDLAARIEKALDEEDLALARSLADEAVKCKVTEIRQAAVDTLGWFGEKALAELTPFLADADEDVRASALSEWSMAVSDIEDEAEKIGVVEMAMQVLSDEDALEEISSEYIGADEKRAVESLVRIIEAEANDKSVAKAKETYEFVTGEEFTDRAAAEKWVQEEYTPSEE